MRIAYVCADLGVPVFGCKGSSVHVQEMIRALRNRGADVELFAMRCNDPRPTELASLITHVLPIGTSQDTGERELRAYESNTMLQSLLERHGPFDAIYERYSLWSYGA